MRARARLLFARRARPIAPAAAAAGARARSWLTTDADAGETRDEELALDALRAILLRPPGLRAGESASAGMRRWSPED